MKRSEFEQIIEEVVERVISKKLEEKIEGLFYKTMVESNFMPNVISTVYEQVSRVSQPVQHAPIVENQLPPYQVLEQQLAVEKEEPMFKLLPDGPIPGGPKGSMLQEYQGNLERERSSREDAPISPEPETVIMENGSNSQKLKIPLTDFFAGTQPLSS